MQVKMGAPEGSPKVVLFIKLTFVINIFVKSIFEWLF